MLPVRCLSKKLTSTGVVTTAGESGLAYGVILIGGTDDSKIILKNGATGGTDTVALTTDGGTNIGDNMNVVMFPVPVWFSTDIYGTLSGTGAYAYVLYAEV